MGIAPAGLKGDHYGSIMFRIKVEYQLDNAAAIRKRSLIVKAMPQMESDKRNMVMEWQLFDVEIKMYSETLPMMEQILAKYGDATKFAPKLVCVCFLFVGLKMCL